MAIKSQTACSGPLAKNEELKKGAQKPSAYSAGNQPIGQSKDDVTMKDNSSYLKGSIKEH